MAVHEAQCNSLADSSNNFISVDGWRKLFQVINLFLFWWSWSTRDEKRGFSLTFPLGMNFENVRKKEATAFAWRLFSYLNRFWNVIGCSFVIHMDDSHFWMLFIHDMHLERSVVTAAASMVFGCKSSICDKNLMLSFTSKKLLFRM